TVARNPRYRLRTRHQPACGMTTAFPHCHNSVSGPWCRGITSYEYDSGVRISQSKSPSKLKYRIVNAYGHSRRPSAATQPVRAPATDAGKPWYTGTYFVIAGLRRPTRIGDARSLAFAPNGPDRHIGSTAGPDRRGGTSGSKSSLPGFLSGGVRGSQSHSTSRTARHRCLRRN